MIEVQLSNLHMFSAEKESLGTPGIFLIVLM